MLTPCDAGVIRHAIPFRGHHLLTSTPWSSLRRSPFFVHLPHHSKMSAHPEIFTLYRQNQPRSQDQVFRHGLPMDWR